MRTSRLEAFSDAVFAIIITVMVLGLRIPTQHDFGSFLATTGHGMLTYLLSFIYVAIYWTNHHRLFHLVARVGAGVLWANLVVLFFLSLLPFTTAWMRESRFAQTPVLVYGLNLLLTGAAYYALLITVKRPEGPDSPLRTALGRDLKGLISPVLYLVGLLSVLFVDRDGRIGVWIALGCYAAVAVMWVIPNPRVDRVIRESGRSG